MDKLLDELYLILETLNSLFKELKELAKAKQPILIKGSIESLDELIKKEQLLIIQVGKLEEKRYQIQQALANHFSISVEAMNMTFLMEKLDESFREKIKSVFNELNHGIDEVKSINDSNAQLIQQSLDFIEYSVNLITSYEDKPIYPEKASSGNSNNNYARIFDRKI